MFSLDLKHEVKDFFAWWAFFIRANISDNESLKAIYSPYQLDFTTPGKAPIIESSLILILESLNLL